MPWKDYIVNHLGWLLVIGVGGIASLWKLLNSTSGSLFGVSTYLRERKRTYLKELVKERNELKINSSKLQDDLADLTRTLDRRVEINRQDAHTIRQFRELCDKHGVSYSHIDVHVTATH